MTTCAEDHPSCPAPVRETNGTQISIRPIVRTATAINRSTILGPLPFHVLDA